MSQIRTEYVSPFYDQTVLQSVLESKSVLSAAAQELAAAFGLQMAANASWTVPHVQMVDFYTKEGIFAGRLSYIPNSAFPNEAYFTFESPVITKERSSRRSGHDQRDSKKITGIINAMKKKDPEPTLDWMVNKYFQPALKYCYGSVANKNSLTPTADLSNEQEIALLKFFMGEDTLAAEALRPEIDKKYKTYLDRLEKRKHSSQAYGRFCRGTTMIGTLPDKTVGGKFYLVGDSQKIDNKDQYTLTNVKRYKTLSDSPVAAQAAILRTYFSGKSTRFSKESEVGIELTDDYFDDIDVAVGYSNTATGTWVALPKHGI